MSISCARSSRIVLEFITPDAITKLRGRTCSQSWDCTFNDWCRRRSQKIVIYERGDSRGPLQELDNKLHPEASVRLKVKNVWKNIWAGRWKYTIRKRGRNKYVRTIYGWRTRDLSYAVLPFTYGSFWGLVVYTCVSYKTSLCIFKNCCIDGFFIPVLYCIVKKRIVKNGIRAGHGKRRRNAIWMRDLSRLRSCLKNDPNETRRKVSTFTFLLKLFLPSIGPEELSFTRLWTLLLNTTAGL